ncbi:hypothetical protein [Priestia taiwanensis]|uniref:Uncharacterized protein n=1 Tax=Priestia taiwanensis TaxID=1347902 RepID=A0A917EQP4_9BACI|nr:hypothetical protein [Priestia taiwanensis]MBM7363020.1 hypothetical protein [Priestia taiwanensis]GGE66956.1 hypothetical protein GCM10007140_16410 [Priestia taiwanensis]
MNKRLLQIVDENREEVIRRRAEMKKKNDIEYHRKLAEYLHANMPVEKKKIK